MTAKRQYCRAYHLDDLRRFPRWAQLATAGGDLPGDTVVYVWDDLSVVTDPVVPGAPVLLDAAAPDDDWARFCREDLEFKPTEG